MCASAQTRADVRLDNPIGGFRSNERSGIVVDRMLEIAVVLLSIVCFVVLDLYVFGCERI